MATTKPDPALSAVKEEEREDLMPPPGWKSVDPDFLKEVKRDEAPPPPAPLLAGLIKQEAMKCEPVKARFWNRGEVGGADGSFCPEAPVCDLGRENRGEVKAVMLSVRRGIEPVELKTAEELAAADEGDDNAGLSPGWGATGTKHKGIFLPPESVEIDRMEHKMEAEALVEIDRMGHKMEAEALKEDVSAFFSEGSVKDRRLTGGEASATEDGRSLVPLKKENVAGVWGVDDEDGPPPGWGAAVTNDLGPGASVEITPLEVKLEEGRPTEGKLAVADEENGDDDDGPPPGWEAAATKDGGAGKEPMIKLESCKLAKGKEKEKGCPPPGRESMAAPAPRPPLPSKPQSATPEMGQVLCGSCRNLLSYPKGAKYVRCLCCQTVSFVLEAHQVGQVYCGRCAVLLMYYYGCPAVRCSCCQFITQIGPHNRRPPLSEQGVTLQSQLALLRPTKSVAQ